jgi:hypothetical protein
MNNALNNVVNDIVVPVSCTLPGTRITTPTDSARRCAPMRLPSLTARWVTRDHLFGRGDPVHLLRLADVPLVPASDHIRVVPVSAV